MRIYFETSSVNHLLGIFSTPEFSSVKTRNLQNEKGRKWQISNITLWEIFLTQNEQRRFELFDFTRCLFHETLISSPEEIVIRYLESGCPMVETQYELDSASLFSTEWTRACKNLDYFFEPDREQLEFLSNHLRFLGKYFVKTSKGYTLKSAHDFSDFSNILNGAFLKHIYDRLVKLYDAEINEDSRNYVCCSMQIVMIILCYGIGFDQSVIERFWNKERITEPLERLEITVNKFPDIFFRGPLANVARMILLQADSRTGRGLYFDALHSIYITYSALYVTNDEHFLKFKKEHTIDPNMRKIVTVEDLGLGTNRLYHN